MGNESMEKEHLGNAKIVTAASGVASYSQERKKP